MNIVLFILLDGFRGYLDLGFFRNIRGVVLLLMIFYIIGSSMSVFTVVVGEGFFSFRVYVLDTDGFY